MAGINQLKSWFFSITTSKNRLRDKDIPDQQTFENLLSSSTFKTESADKAKVSTGATISSEQGLVVLASNTQAKSNITQLIDRSLVTQPHQLPTVEVVSSSSSEDMPTTNLTIDAIANTTRNQYGFRLASSWINWLISRLIPQGGSLGHILIKQSSTNYHTAWGQLANDTTFINSLLANTTFVNNITTQIIANNPAAITDGLEVGFMRLYSNTTVPAKWLRMDGTAISRITYASLFTLLGTSYGVGDGSTTFNIPDFRDRQATGYSGTKALASSGGADSRIISSGNLPPHTHELGGASGTFSGTTDFSGAHSHTLALKQTSASCGDKPAGSDDPDGCGNASADVISGGNHQHNVSGSVTLSAGNSGNGGFANTALDTKDQYLAVNMIIKVLP